MVAPGFLATLAFARIEKRLYRLIDNRVGMGSIAAIAAEIFAGRAVAITVQACQSALFKIEASLSTTRHFLAIPLGPVGLGNGFHGPHRTPQKQYDQNHRHGNLSAQVPEPTHPFHFREMIAAHALSCRLRWERVRDSGGEGSFLAAQCRKSPHPPFGHLLPCCARAKAVETKYVASTRPA